MKKVNVILKARTLRMLLDQVCKTKDDDISR
ncbi:hypothetical protein A21D_00289 [Virgibacillus dokdonensis]|uniref:Uncharacterized protein n=1 Tax=Virgibacillus dokdonensis TaxID=302167 RepID=A0A2K9IUF2_9BACI|nr:hypothetical protein A21D_00289 [Virgibacillus dokdonensis]